MTLFLLFIEEENTRYIEVITWLNHIKLHIARARASEHLPDSIIVRAKRVQYNAIKRTRAL